MLHDLADAPAFFGRWVRTNVEDAFSLFSSPAQNRIKKWKSILFVKNVSLLSIFASYSSWDWATRRRESETHSMSSSLFLVRFLHEPQVKIHTNDTFIQIHQTTLILAHLTIFLPPPYDAQSLPALPSPSSLFSSLANALTLASRNFGTFKPKSGVRTARGYLQALTEFCRGSDDLEMVASVGRELKLVDVR